MAKGTKTKSTHTKGAGEVESFLGPRLREGAFIVRAARIAESSAALVDHPVTVVVDAVARFGALEGAVACRDHRRIDQAEEWLDEVVTVASARTLLGFTE